MTSPNKNSSRIDYGLILILLMMFITSCIAIYSAQTTGQYDSNFVLKQVLYYMVGIGIILVVVRFDSEQLMGMAWYLYGLGLVLLMLLIVSPPSIAPRINGAKSWFQLPGLSLQPSEFIKVFLILTLARVLIVHHQKNPVKTIRSDMWLLIKLGLVTLFPLLLVMQQPDLGTSLVFLSILLGMIFVSGITWKILLPLFGSAAALTAGIFYMVLWHPLLLEKYLGVKQYQFGRIYSWLDPYTYESSTGFHLTRSLLAIGSGQTMGKGFGYREVYLPESHTDFIFSIIGEEYGFIGASIVVSLFFLLVYHITKLALGTKIPYYTYMCAGVIAMITFHAFQNIGMTIGLLPITGIPLPFISYGGSSLMGNMFAISLIFSMTFNERQYMFSSDR
ncbi:FtsW/RodA/SpoVE family cell cycle protein [Pseudobacillus badius]|uniref:FtsW/RodA/SpoVE family cell cycle protein n=1 Tax=Bacillus badius TaxID=1455 RepID=UPI0007B08A32|nr:FtsW/RodA/SpoVE family cell cycle protein [Bacillus badius]KZO00334.1 rod shape-determining protein RodA [Bacillus badius]MED0668386.1 FtsW/RodA/SpoVE family cell cycle protein [Bacillus badius]OCS86501.1 rod shape-determining protein RodA [Bacillus badius]OVE52036.1 rod shape-determining protein RodA [Bacillus badius]TDW03735.1 rod shape determining protein RodA [Bacillus badius]